MAGVIMILATLGVLISVVFFFAALIPTARNRTRDQRERSFRLRLWSGITGFCFLIWYAAVSHMQPNRSQPRPKLTGPSATRLRGGFAACPTKEMLQELLGSQTAGDRKTESRLLNTGCFITKAGTSVNISGELDPNGLATVVVKNDNGRTFTVWTQAGNLLSGKPAPN